APGFEPFAPGYETFAPGSETFAPGSEAFAPGCEAFSPRSEMFQRRTVRSIMPMESRLALSPVDRMPVTGPSWPLRVLDSFQLVVSQSLIAVADAGGSPGLAPGVGVA